MSEIASTLYDLTYPSPITLKEISSMAVGLELWRLELNKHRLNKTVNKFKLDRDIPTISIIPGLPRTIYLSIVKHINKFGSSIEHWLSDHFFGVFLFHYKNLRDILDHFDDFVYDCDGTVHYTRTAKRMMLCDKFSDEEKFKIACMYCFENDIRQLWPSVSSKYVNLNEIDFPTFPSLFYWISNLKNELDSIPNPNNDPVDEIMIDHCRHHYWTSIEYFWNRMTLESQSQKAYDLFIRHKKLFVRYILPKLNDQVLDRFVAEKGGKMIIEFLADTQYEIYVLSTWAFIKNKINDNNFTYLVEAFLKIDANHHIIGRRLSEYKDQPFSYVNMTYLFCKIWKSASRNLRQSAIKKLLCQSNETLFRKKNIMPSEPREIKFLLTVLLDATFDDRSTFWHKNWQNLIVNTRGEDLIQIMKICFENEDEITEFKASTLSKYDNISPYCIKLLEDGFFDELDYVLNFCCTNTQTRKDLKRRLLRLNFFGEKCILNVLHFGRVQTMSEFIDDAFESHTLAMDFKNQLALLPVTDNCLLKCIHFGYFPSAMNFANTFVGGEERMMELKKRFLGSLREHLISGFVSNIRVVFLQEFIAWCLQNDDEEIAKFKNSLSVDEIFLNMVEKERYYADHRNGVMRYPLNLNEFLMWYYDTPEEIREFKIAYEDVFQIFSPRR